MHGGRRVRAMEREENIQGEWRSEATDGGNLRHSDFESLSRRWRPGVPLSLGTETNWGPCKP